MNFSESLTNKLSEKISNVRRDLGNSLKNKLVNIYLLLVLQIETFPAPAEILPSAHGWCIRRRKFVLAAKWWNPKRQWKGKNPDKVKDGNTPSNLIRRNKQLQQRYICSIHPAGLRAVEMKILESRIPSLRSPVCGWPGSFGEWE